MTARQFKQKYHLKYFRGAIFSNNICTGQLFIETRSNTVYFCQNHQPGANNSAISNFFNNLYRYNYAVDYRSDYTFAWCDRIELSDTPFPEGDRINRINELYHNKEAGMYLSGSLESYLGVLFVDGHGKVYFCTDSYLPIQGNRPIRPGLHTGKRYSYPLELNPDYSFNVNQNVTITLTEALIDNIRSRITNIEQSINRKTKNLIKKVNNIVNVTIDDIADCFDCLPDEIEIEGYIKV